LVYKDQQVSTLERLLNVWLESSSSEDNESNTTPHDRAGNGYCSSQVLTSSDESSDGNAWINGGKASTCNPKKSKFEDNADSGISEEPPKNYSKKPSTQTAVKHKYTKVSRRDKTVNNNLSKPSKITCDVEMRYESESSDSSCKEPPRKKVAKSSENSSSMKVSNCWKPKDHDSGLSSPPMTPMTTGHSDCSTVSNVGNSQQNIHPSWSSSSGSNCGVRRASRDLVAVGNKLQQSILEKKDHHYSGESTSSNDEEARNKRNVIPHINLQRPRPKKIVISPEQKKELRRKKLIDRSKSKDFKVILTINFKISMRKFLSTKLIKFDFFKIQIALSMNLNISSWSIHTFVRLWSPPTILLVIKMYFILR
jgi:timeless protein